MLPEAPVPIWQNPTEFEEFYKYISVRDPKNILEIGSFYGGTLWHWTRLKPALLVAIDLPVPQDSEHHGGVWESRAQWHSWMRDIEFHDIIGPSHNDWFVWDKVQKATGERRYDFMFIDGDHSYNGVKMDFATYVPLLADGGVVAFHDTVRHEPGVIKFVEEIKWLYPSVTFFSPDWGAGITAFRPKG